MFPSFLQARSGALIRRAARSWLPPAYQRGRMPVRHPRSEPVDGLKLSYDPSGRIPAARVRRNARSDPAVVLHAHRLPCEPPPGHPRLLRCPLLFVSGPYIGVGNREAKVAFLRCTSSDCGIFGCRGARNSNVRNQPTGRCFSHSRVRCNELHRHFLDGGSRPELGCAQRSHLGVLHSLWCSRRLGGWDSNQYGERR